MRKQRSGEIESDKRRRVGRASGIEREGAKEWGFKLGGWRGWGGRGEVDGER